jgi:hypothetical protein
VARNDKHIDILQSYRIAVSIALSILTAVDCELSMADDSAQWFFSAQVPVVCTFQSSPITNAKSSTMTSSTGDSAQSRV